MEFTAPAIAYQVILFLALYAVLKRLVFDRFLENLDQRHQHTRGALEGAAKLREESARLTADYERQMVEIRRQAAAAREEIRRSAEAEERDLIETARAAATRSLAEARARIDAEVRATRTSLEAEITELSEAALAKLLGHSA